MAKKGIYKIRDPETGLFSTGGTRPEWHKTGKIWKQLGHLKAHLNQVRTPVSQRRYGRPLADYTNAEIVTFEMVETEAKPVAELQAEVKQAKQDRETKRQERYRQFKEEQEKAELRKLKAKYPNV
jgi:hypothetical protein